MCRIDRHRSQQRVEFFLAIFRDEAHCLGIEFVKPEHPDSVFRQRGAQARIPAIVLIIDECVRLLVQHVPFFGKSQAIGASLVIAVFDLLHHRGDAHLEKFVEITGGDG